MTLCLQLHSLQALGQTPNNNICTNLSAAQLYGVPRLDSNSIQRCSLTQHCELGPQVNQVVEIGNRQEGRDKFDNISKWANQINTLRNTVLNKLQ